MLLFKNSPLDDPLAQFAWEKLIEAKTSLGPDFSDSPKLMLEKDRVDSAHILPSTLVFVDGRYSQNDSFIPGEGIQILPVEQAKKSYKNFFSIDLRKKIEEEKQLAALVNHSYSDQGVFIYLSPDQGSVSITVRHIFSEDAEGICFPRVHCIVGANSYLTLVIEQATKKGVWVNQLIDLHLAAHSQLKLVELLDNSEGVLIDTIRASLKESAFFDAVIISKGAEMVYRDFHAKLLGAEAEARVSLACHLHQKKEERMEVLMELKAPLSRSFQKVKHVGHKNSRHHFNGKIYVHREAQKSDSYQRHQALLLDDHAFQTVKPELEIFADDVKASHGASCGNLNAEHLFYFASRGIEKKAAEQLLVQGHLQEIAESITDPIARKRASEILR